MQVLRQLNKQFDMIFTDPPYFLSNGGMLMTDVWKLPTVEMWEKTCGKYPTQKPLRLLYRIILASTIYGETILDPFTGSCTAGIASNLLDSNFVGIDQSVEYLDLGIRRKIEIEDLCKSIEVQKLMSENPEEVTVLVNHARKETREKMIETGICYLRAGDSHGSLSITPGFERIEYVLLHTGGNDCQLFKLKKKVVFKYGQKRHLKIMASHHCMPCTIWFSCLIIKSLLISKFQQILLRGFILMLQSSDL